MLSATHSERIKRIIGNSGAHPDVVQELCAAIDRETEIPLPAISRTITAPFDQESPTRPIPPETMEELRAREDAERSVRLAATRTVTL